MAKMITSSIRAMDLRVGRPLRKKADDELLTPAHKAWRLKVCGRADWRCEFVENGYRCQRSRANGDRMIADHVRERKDGGALLDLDNGQCLCVQHNTLKGIAARQRRMEEKF